MRHLRRQGFGRRSAHHDQSGQERPTGPCHLQRALRLGQEYHFDRLYRYGLRPRAYRQPVHERLVGRHDGHFPLHRRERRSAKTLRASQRPYAAPRSSMGRSRQRRQVLLLRQLRLVRLFLQPRAVAAGTQPLSLGQYGQSILLRKRPFLPTVRHVQHQQGQVQRLCLPHQGIGPDSSVAEILEQHQLRHHGLQVRRPSGLRRHDQRPAIEHLRRIPSLQPRRHDRTIRQPTGQELPDRSRPRRTDDRRPFEKHARETLPHLLEPVRRHALQKARPHSGLRLPSAGQSLQIPQQHVRIFAPAGRRGDVHVGIGRKFLPRDTPNLQRT